MRRAHSFFPVKIAKVPTSTPTGNLRAPTGAAAQEEYAKFLDNRDSVATVNVG
jgi:hypothetical protein